MLSYSYIKKTWNVFTFCHELTDIFYNKDMCKAFIGYGLPHVHFASSHPQSMQIYNSVTCFYSWAGIWKGKIHCFSLLLFFAFRSFPYVKTGLGASHCLSVLLSKPSSPCLWVPWMLCLYSRCAIYLLLIVLICVRYDAPIRLEVDCRQSPYQIQLLADK